MKPKSPQAVIDSRHLKILAAKKDQLKDAVVFICLDEKKYGLFDVAQLRKMAEVVDKIEPSGCYFLGMKDLKVNIYDRAEIKNKDIIITVGHNVDEASDRQIEEDFERAFADARSIKYVHHYAEDIT